MGTPSLNKVLKAIKTADPGIKSTRRKARLFLNIF
jgi:hypothetical protein